jgi:hypothetical protein
LYQQLELSAKQKGVPVESYAENMLADGLSKLLEAELSRRSEIVDRILAFQKKMGEKYGVMEDSVELIREDRER